MKIMIVDDEVIIRNGLCTVIDWKELGLDLIPPASSAEEALERIPLEKPDILLTDIRMSGMDGIELAKIVKETRPDTEVIILTGYDDFAYAQQALRGGVMDYLLKTSRPEEIIKAAMKAKQTIAEKREWLRQDIRQRNAANEQALLKLLQGGADGRNAAEIERIREAFRNRMPEAAAGEGQDDWRAVLLSAGGWGEQSSGGLLLGAVDNILRELLPCMTLVDRDRLILVLRGNPGEEQDDRAGLSAALRRVEQILKCEIFAAAGQAANGFESLRRSYEEAADIYSYKGLIGTRGLFSAEHLAGRTGGRAHCSVKEEAELSAILMNNDATGLRHWTNQTVRARADDPAATPATLQAYVQSMLLAGHRWLESVRDGRDEDGETPPSFPATFAYDWEARPEEEAFKMLSAVMSSYHQSLARSKFSYVRKAIAYIKEHLDQPLSLQQVAGFVHSNPNHFSEVFKRETGMTYLEFVTRERMRKAEELLSGTPCKVVEIASRVGYSDIKYFTQQFKKHAGRTPSEYRQTAKEAEE